MYAIHDERIQDIRVGCDEWERVSERKSVLLVTQGVKSLSQSSILVMPIMAINLFTGEIIYRANFFLHTANEVEFLEVFEEYIFIKQKGHRLVIYSVAPHPCIIL